MRRQEHRALSRRGNSPLKHWRYLWLSNQEYLTDLQRERFDKAYSRELATGKVSAYKEMLRDLWHHPTATSATAYLLESHQRVIHTRIEPMKNVARTLKERLPNIVSYCTDQITRAVAEGMNSKII